jgi:hypothetical protein
MDGEYFICQRITHLREMGGQHAFAERAILDHVIVSQFAKIHNPRSPQRHQGHREELSAASRQEILFPPVFAETKT